MNYMFFIGFGKDQNIVKVSDDEVVQVFLERVVDQGLEGSGCVGKPERHHQVLVLAVSSTKCCFPFFPLLNADSVVYLADVDCGEPFRALKAVLQFVNPWQGVAVLDRHIVEFPIVHAESFGFVLLWHEKDWRRCGSARFTDEPFGKVLLKVFLELDLLLSGE